MTTRTPEVMAGRDANLQAFVFALEAAFESSGVAGTPAALFTQKLFDALLLPASAGSTSSAHLPVCDHLTAALQIASVATTETSSLANSIEKLAPRLTWKVRSGGGENASANWPDSHANAVIVGAGGLEERTDVAIGLSLLAPDVRYPDHTHPPEELYMILTPAKFQHGDEEWKDLRPADTFHNPPGIKHAMASHQVPLLAVWTMLVS